MNILDRKSAWTPAPSVGTLDDPYEAMRRATDALNQLQPTLIEDARRWIADADQFYISAGYPRRRQSASTSGPPEATNRPTRKHGGGRAPTFTEADVPKIGAAARAYARRCERERDRNPGDWRRNISQEDFAAYVSETIRPVTVRTLRKFMELHRVPWPKMD